MKKFTNPRFVRVSEGCMGSITARLNGYCYGIKCDDPPRIFFNYQNGNDETDTRSHRSCEELKEIPDITIGKIKLIPETATFYTDEKGREGIIFGQDIDTKNLLVFFFESDKRGMQIDEVLYQFPYNLQSKQPKKFIIHNDKQSNFKECLDTGKFGDYVLEHNQETFVLNCVILNNMSDYFCNKFKENNYQKDSMQNDIPDKFQTKTVKDMIDFIYTGHYEIDYDVATLLEMYELANYLGVKKFIELFTIEFNKIDIDDKIFDFIIKYPTLGTTKNIVDYLKKNKTNEERIVILENNNILALRVATSIFDN